MPTAMETARSNISSRAQALDGSDNLAWLKDKVSDHYASSLKWYKDLLAGIVTEQFSGFETTLMSLFDGRTDDPAYQEIWSKWNNMQRKAIESERTTTGWFVKRHAEIEKEYGEVEDFGRKLNYNGYQYTVNELVATYLITRGDARSEGATALYESNPDLHSIKVPEGKSSAEIAAMRREHFDGMVKFASDFIASDKTIQGMVVLVDDFYEYIYDRVAPIYKKVHGETLGKVPFYFPRVREGGLFMDGDWLAGLMEITPTKVRARLDPETRFKQRKMGAKGSKIRLDVVGVLNAYRRQVDNYIGKAESIAELASVFSADQDVIQKLAIDKGRMREMRIMAHMIERERFATGRMEPMQDWEIAFRKARVNFQWAAIVLNAPSVIRQTISGWNAQADVPGIMTPFKYWGLYAKNMASVVTKARAKVDGDALDNASELESLRHTRGWKLMRKYNSQQIAGSFDIVDTELIAISEQSVRSLRVGKWLNIKDALMFPQRIFDMAGRVTAFEIAWDYKNAELRKQGLSEEEAGKKAAEYADDITNRANNPVSAHNMNLAQTGSEMMRSLIPFTGQQMVMFDYTRNHIIRPLKQAWEAGNNTSESLRNMMDVLFINPPQGTDTTVVRKIAFTLIVPALALGWVARGGFQRKWEDVAKDLIMYNLTLVPVLGPAIATAMFANTAVKTGVPMYTELITSITDIAHKMYKATHGEATVADIGDEILDLLPYAGLPAELVRQVRRWENGFWDENPMGFETVLKAVRLRPEDID